jgi:hypothetical protein
MIGISGFLAFVRLGIHFVIQVESFKPLRKLVAMDVLKVEF